MKARLAATVATLAVLAASSAVAQSRAPGLVPSPSSVEAGLWSTSDRLERNARASAELNADADLNAYVREIMCSIASEYCSEVRVYVMDRQIFNAMVAPNGYIEVWSGLLLRAQSDAELAFVLGHEISHYAENHTVERFNTQKTYATIAMVVTLGAGLAGAYYGVDLSSVGDLAYLTAMSAFYGYNRRQESEADTLGLHRAADAGYDPAAGASIWRALQEETAASTFPSVRRSEAANSLFRTHPLTGDRIAALARHGATLTATATPEKQRADRQKHRAAIRPFLRPWLEEELLRRDFGGLLVVLERLDDEGEDIGVLDFYRGEVFRQRRGDGDLEEARRAYQSAVTHADAPVAAWRELGDVEHKLGDHTAARAAWQRYLAAAPDADDRWIVEDSLKSLETT